MGRFRFEVRREMEYRISQIRAWHNPEPPPPITVVKTTVVHRPSQVQSGVKNGGKYKRSRAHHS